MWNIAYEQALLEVKMSSFFCFCFSVRKIDSLKTCWWQEEMHNKRTATKNFFNGISSLTVAHYKKKNDFEQRKEAKKKITRLRRNSKKKIKPIYWRRGYMYLWLYGNVVSFKEENTITTWQWKNKKS